MLVHTHILFSIFCIILANKYLEIPSIALFSIVVIFFTLLPDIDEDQSTMGKKIWPISTFIEKFLGHRGILHSLLIPILLYIAFYIFGLQVYGIAAAIGYTSHLIMDAITSCGIHPVWPLPFRIHGPIRTGSVLEHLVFIIIVLFILLFIF